MLIRIRNTEFYGYKKVEHKIGSKCSKASCCLWQQICIHPASCSPPIMEQSRLRHKFILSLASCIPVNLLFGVGGGK